MARTRRLAAVMFTDMVGFTRSAQSNESGALKLLDEQEKLVRPILVAHRGREIKSTGDGFLIEFDSALQATECAVAIQRRIHDRNSESSSAPLELRIGVHLGDIERRHGDIFGDAVNVASRIGPCAEPGGICISGPVFDQVHNKLANPLKKLDTRSLKNVRFPVDVYQVVLPWVVPGARREASGPIGLAVLPFANISPDPKDEYFADGLTEELITVLSQLSELRVIARTSVLQYKSTTKPVAQIGSELGVSAILEGSVRKAGDRLRITAQLIDPASGGHTWAKTFDRELNDVFAVQADIATLVAAALKLELQQEDAARIRDRHKVRADSYLAYLKGRDLMGGPTPSSLAAARAQFELAISLDESNAAAHSGLSDAAMFIRQFQPETDPRLSQRDWDKISRTAAARAIELDPNLAEAHATLGLVHWDDYEFAAAEEEFKKALSLNPSYAKAHLWYGGLLIEEGRLDEALLERFLAEGADPSSPMAVGLSAELLLWLGRLDEALPRIDKLARLDPDGPLYFGYLSEYLSARSDIEGSIKSSRRATERETRPRWKRLHSARDLIHAGDFEKARRILQEEETLPAYPPTDWAMALVYAELHDLDGCFRWLNKAVDHHTAILKSFRADPRLEHVRKDPRFRLLLQRVNLA
jgi:adenylate cyclase